MTDASTVDEPALLSLTADIVAAHVKANKVAPAELPVLITSVHAALAGLGAAPKEEALTPAVSVRASVKPDHLVCLEDGKTFKTLKRHLMTSHGLTPDEYRAKWNLPADYPLVAPAYAASRSTLAKAIGLGRKAGTRRAAPARAEMAGSSAASAPAAASEPAAPRRRRRGKLGIAV
ncbi:MucR family transcriptional regulator [Brevundimonas diminuta]|uniref:MucR family transcriptional regulator n=1 Tax=Brevundimonas diminuta TaxID=293 RepID=UPI0030F6459D